MAVDPYVFEYGIISGTCLNPITVATFELGGIHSCEAAVEGGSYDNPNPAATPTSLGSQVNFYSSAFDVPGCYYYTEESQWEGYYFNPQNTQKACGGKYDCICIATCDVNEGVIDGKCTTCAPGTTNEAGDVPTQGDSTCASTICEVNQYVSSHVCTNCAAGKLRDARDDASGSDTSCGTCDDGTWLDSGVCTDCTPIDGADEGGVTCTSATDSQLAYGCAQGFRLVDGRGLGLGLGLGLVGRACEHCPTGSYIATVVGYQYTQIESGTCEDEELLTDVPENRCDDAAAWLDWGLRGNVNSYWSEDTTRFAPGCIKGDGYIHWYYNINESAPGQCSPGQPCACSTEELTYQEFKTCTTVQDAATVTCTSDSNSVATTCNPGSWLDLDSGVCTACTAVKNGLEPTVLTCTSATTSKLDGGCKSGFWKNAGTADDADECTKCNTVIGADTVTCTSALNSVAATCKDGFWFGTSGTADVCTECTTVIGADASGVICTSADNSQLAGGCAQGFRLVGDVCEHAVKIGDTFFLESGLLVLKTILTGFASSPNEQRKCLSDQYRALGGC